MKIMKHQFDFDKARGREPSLTGFIEEVRWVPTAYGNPRVHREYLCSNGDGKTFRLWCTGANTTASFMVRDYMGSDHWDDTCIRFEGEEKDEITLEELKKLSGSYDVWYREFEDYGEYGERNAEYLICKEPPKYWLQNEPIGPMDDEIETYEVEITNDLDKAHNREFENKEMMKQEEREITDFANEVVFECERGRRFHEEFPSEKVADMIFQTMRKAGLL